MAKFTHLISALLAFCFVFWIFYYFAPGVSAFSIFTAKFIGSIVLTLLCIYVIYGFSNLRLNRTVYLAIGAVGALLVINIAKPLIARTNLISRSSSFCVKPIDVSLSVSKYSKTLTGVSNDELNKKLYKVRNGIYMGISGFLGRQLPSEPVYVIFFLGLAQLLLASGIGIWIGDGIDKITHLIPLALVAALADIWSVFAGATSIIVVSSTIHYFFLRLPVFGMSVIPPLIGLTDYLFFAIFFQATVKFKLPIVKNVALLAISFPLTAWLALFCGIGLPVLPFMGALFVVGNINSLSLDKKEIKQFVAILLAISLIFALISYFIV